MKPGMQRLAIAGALLVFLLIAGWHIASPGLYFDEMLFVDAALGQPNNVFHFINFGPVPIMLMNYIGALKAWIYYPIFKLFGVTAASVRWPVILIGALTLWLNYKVMLRAFSRQAALVFLAMAAVEPSTLFHTRLDWGPTALMMLFRALLLLATVQWIKTREPKYLAAGVLAAFVGIFDKLNFLWFGPALALALAVIYPRQLVDFIRQHLKFSIALGIVLAAAGVGLLVYTRYALPLEGEIGHFDLQQRLETVRLLLLSTVTGTGVYSVVTTKNDLVAVGLPHLLVLAGALVAAVALAFPYRRNIDWKMTAFFALFFGITLVELLATRQATGPHHSATMAPWWLLLLAVPLGAAIASDSQWRRLVAGAAVAVVVVSSLRVDVLNLQGFATAPGHAWDPGSTTLAQELGRHSGQPVVIIDWGSGSIINGLLNGKVELHDDWYPLYTHMMDEATIAGYDAMIRTREPVFVLPAEGAETFPATRENFLALAAEHHWTLQKLKTINSLHDTPLYELYTAQATSP